MSVSCYGSPSQTRFGTSMLTGSQMLMLASLSRPAFAPPNRRLILASDHTPPFTAISRSPRAQFVLPQWVTSQSGGLRAALRFHWISSHQFSTFSGAKRSSDTEIMQPQRLIIAVPIEDDQDASLNRRTLDPMRTTVRSKLTQAGWRKIVSWNDLRQACITPGWLSSCRACVPLTADHLPWPAASTFRQFASPAPDP